ncbi:quinone oxidoreductase family protein [Leifsonia sp. AG29]|uniref:quinone oxidoreductase family protein n=1 Tax=Leifsonia sp. AG29 TaxID=2598860 RepID=UPI001E4380B3|nr:zinc-binding dehydrogenase [Leifsonia sp. AG29]
MGGIARTSALVSRFGDPSAVVLAAQEVAPPSGNDVLVRVTHASLGATDVLARRGRYVLQPAPGFVGGYDFVGELESESAVSVALGLRRGARVAGVLPRMGSHSTRIVVAPTLLVAVPESLSSPDAAVLPLDGVTAFHALELCGPAPHLLVQGVSGAVGLLAAQLALQEGRSVIGTASARSRSAAERLGVEIVDYTQADWAAAVRRVALGPVGAAIDHTGSAAVREAVGRDGVVVRTAFVGRPGHERADSLRGTADALRRRHPRERVCSVPLYLVTQRAAYRRALARLLGAAASGELSTQTPDVFQLGQIWEAHRAADEARPGRKVVLAVG